MNSFLIAVLLIGGLSGLIEAEPVANQPESQSIGEEYGIRPDWDFSREGQTGEQTLDPKCSLESLQQLADAWKIASINDVAFDEMRRNALEAVEICVPNLLVSKRNPELSHILDQVRPNILAAKSCSDVAGSIVPRIASDKVVNGVVDYLISQGDIRVKDYKKKLFGNRDGKKFSKLRRLLNGKVVYEFYFHMNVTESGRIVDKILELIDSMKIRPTEHVREELIDYRIGSVFEDFMELDSKMTMGELLFQTKPMSGQPLAMVDTFAEAALKELKRRANEEPVIC